MDKKSSVKSIRRQKVAKFLASDESFYRGIYFADETFHRRNFPPTKFLPIKVHKRFAREIQHLYFLEPTYLKHVIQALKDETINDKVFQLLLVTLKEQWMGYGLLFYHFLSCWLLWY